MKLLLDQVVYAATATFLRNSGHDVITASDIGRSRALFVLMLPREDDRFSVDYFLTWRKQQHAA